MQVVTVIYTDHINHNNHATLKQYALRDELDLELHDMAVVYSKRLQKFSIVKVVATHPEPTKQLLTVATESTHTKLNTDSIE